MLYHFRAYTKPTRLEWHRHELNMCDSEAGIQPTAEQDRKSADNISLSRLSTKKIQIESLRRLKRHTDYDKSEILLYVASMP